MAGQTLASTAPGYARPLSRRPLGQWLVLHTRRGRLRRYARAMGWHLSTDGVLVGDVEGILRGRLDEGDLGAIAAPGVHPHRRQRHEGLGDLAGGNGARLVAVLSRQILGGGELGRPGDPGFARCHGAETCCSGGSCCTNHKSHS